MAATKNTKAPSSAKAASATKTKTKVKTKAHAKTKSATPEVTPSAASEATKKAPAKREPTKRGPKPRTARKASGLDLAARVLADASEPLDAKTIAERVVAAGWKTSGATPHATLFAAIGREIASKGKDARFRKTGRGLFTATPTATATNGKGA